MKQPTGSAADHAAEYQSNTRHDWIVAIARKTRQYGKHPTEETARLVLDSIGRMADAYRLLERGK